MSGSASNNTPPGGGTVPTTTTGAPPHGGGTLPFTGFDLGLYVAVGAAMIAGGLVLRRRSSLRDR